MNLSSRLRALERHRVTGLACAACGLVPGAPLPPSTKITIEVPGAVEFIEREPVQAEPEDFCAGCGRQMVFRLSADRLG